jgi:hypothetical protein
VSGDKVVSWFVCDNKVGSGELLCEGSRCAVGGAVDEYKVSGSKECGVVMCEPFPRGVGVDMDEGVE